MSTCTDCGFVELTIRTGGSQSARVYVNPHWIVEIRHVDRENPDRGADLVLLGSPDESLC